jgi:Zn-dependent protease
LFDIFTKSGLIEFIFTLPALLISLTIHEWAHAYTAYKLGDNSQKALGRLTLDPFSHIDPMGFICIALFGFGWGKPVVFDDRNFKNKSKGNMLVALAGPLSNIIMAVLCTLILKVLVMLNFASFDYPTVISVTSIIGRMLLLTIGFNIVFGIFNMIPIPPFDGSKVLFYFLPGKYKNIMYMLERYSFIIIIVILVTNIASIIISPIVNFIYTILMYILLI